MKNRFSLVVAVLLALNGIFLYYNWVQRSAPDSHTALQEEIQKVTKQELWLSLNGYLVRKPELRQAKSKSVWVFVHERHCSMCKEEARPYWKAIAENGSVDFKIYYYSIQPRGWERFALWMEFPKEYIVAVKSIAPADTLPWSSSAPSVIVVDNQTKEIRLAHAGSSLLRKRSSVFYEFLVEYLTGKDFTAKF